MTKADSARKVKISELASKLVELVDIFRQAEAATGFPSWYGHSGRFIFDPAYGYQNKRPQFDEIVENIIRLNPKMLSKSEVGSQLQMFLLWQASSVTKTTRLYAKKLTESAEEQLEKLVSLKAWHTVDIPIVNVRLDGPPITIGEVTFKSVAKDELEQWKQQTLWYEPAPDFECIAQVRAPGDTHKATAYAELLVKQAVDILRAFCLPFTSEWIGPEPLLDIFVPIYSSVKVNTIRLDDKFFPGSITGGIHTLKLKQDLISKLNHSEWELINKLLTKTLHNRMEKKLLLSIHWLSESTKMDTNNSRFMKISNALEALIGGESKDESLQVRGITSMLAERAAFIAGKDLDDRLAIDEYVRKYYGIRGRVVHSGEGNTSPPDIKNFGELVRRITLALLEKMNILGEEIGDVEKLERWIKTLKYTLSTNTVSNNTKEAS